MATPESFRGARDAHENSDRKDRLCDFFVLFVSLWFIRIDRFDRPGWAVGDTADDGRIQLRPLLERHRRDRWLARGVSPANEKGGKNGPP